MPYYLVDTSWHCVFFLPLISDCKWGQLKAGLFCPHYISPLAYTHCDFLSCVFGCSSAPGWMSPARTKPSNARRVTSRSTLSSKLSSITAARTTWRKCVRWPGAARRGRDRRGRPRGTQAALSQVRTHASPASSSVPGIIAQSQFSEWHCNLLSNNY